MIACPGLGHVGRGFETFSQECFDVLRAHDDLEMTLVKGAGRRGEGVRVARTVKRGGRLARAAGRLVGRDPYVVEQVVFAATCIPLLRSFKPDVVVFSDWAFGRALGRWRRTSGAGFRLLLSNGAAGPPPYDPAVDHVQQLTPQFLELALAAGEPRSRHTLLPLGLRTPAFEAPVETAQRQRLRRRLGLPVDRPVVLSVAALNAWSKRLDHLIREVARLRPRPYLALVGQPEDETAGVLDLARSLLGEDGFVARTVTPPEVADFYLAADVAVLCSLYEGQGRVLLEALAHGAPVIAHDAHWSRYATGGHARLIDMSVPGPLADELRHVLDAPPDAAQSRRAQRHVRENFGWESLAPRYVEMIRGCAGAQPARRASAQSEPATRLA